MTPSGTGRGLRGSLRALAAAVVLAALAAPLQAQQGGSSAGSGPSRSLAAPTTGAGSASSTRGIGSPGESLTSPGINSGVLRPFEKIGPLRGQIPPALSSPPGSGISPGAGQVGLVLSARFGEKAGPITGGLHWRVYPDRPDSTGRFNLVKEDRSANPTFVLPPGGYVVHVNAGLASAAKHVNLRAETVKQTFDLPAGGIRLEGRVGGVRIPAGQISFDI